MNYDVKLFNLADKTKLYRCSTPTSTPSPTRSDKLLTVLKVFRKQSVADSILAHEVNVTSPSRDVEQRTNALTSEMAEQPVQISVSTTTLRKHSFTIPAVDPTSPSKSGGSPSTALAIEPIKRE
ncbi:unnamed protein product [Angiostrongylus costaricensis]|uniref:Uncharacterized protein n=1 Tax=Angiostrongylus costaricensis TaxID=334426 RepID=A0A0R3PA86_ANGCS|nr:unnamed protein product [Angiostrongylus costaricensis]